MKKVVIIGSGLSGLTCAHYIDKSNFNIEIYESNSSSGGRAQSENIDGYICDKGFQVLLNNYNEIKKIDIYNDLDLKFFDSGATIYTDNKNFYIYNPLVHPIKFLSSNIFSVFRLKDIYKILTNFLIKRKSSVRTSYELMNKNLSQKARDLFFYPFFKGIFLNESLSNDSKFFIKIFKKFAKGRAGLPSTGMSELPDSIIRKNDFNIRYKHKLSSIKDNFAYFENGENIRYDIIIFAIPINAINDILGTSYKSSYLSNKTLYVSSTQCKLGKSILLVSDNRYHSNSIQCLTNISSDYSKNNDSLYSISTLNHTVSDQVLLDEFIKICNLDRDTCSIIKSYSIPNSLHRDTLNINNSNDIFFCGDWTCEPSIDGAMKSGRLVAEKINESAEHNEKRS